MEKQSCPVCESGSLQGLESHGRPFYFCSKCEYVFQSPEARPSFEEEKSRYLEHNNDIEDPRYIKYLKKTWKQLEPPNQGRVVLDYGCGPTKGLEMLLGAKYQVLSFDPIFWPQDLSLESGSVDVVFCSEAIEHVFSPSLVFDQWNQLLKPGGAIVLRTCFHPGPESMKDWWYASDETHIGFFNQSTFEWIAKNWGWRLDKVHSPYVCAQVISSLV